jgi:hypothetical protein
MKMNELENDVKDMLSDEPIVVEPTIEAPTTVAPITTEENIAIPEVPEVPAPVLPAEPDVTVVPVVEVPVVPVAAVPVEPIVPDTSEVDALKAQIASMREMIEKISAQATTPAVQAVPSEPVAPGVIKFIEKEEDLDKALNSADNFNTMLTGVVQKAQEYMLSSLPQMVGQMADRIVGQRLAAKEFYDNNKDLSANKAFVSIVANEMAAANPGWDMSKLMENLSSEVRKRLNLVVAAGGTPQVAPTVVAPNAPAFVPPGGARPGGGAPPMDAMAKDIMDLIND